MEEQELWKSEGGLWAAIDQRRVVREVDRRIAVWAPALAQHDE